ncbi:MAG: ParA family protein [Betaproteobacteria bacterium HGW-Betaproteobacteria-8]|nr:MAG: ParA family protein [Betaproteobacteria bacterium HGW-Betaproteobacteria-8]
MTRIAVFNQKGGVGKTTTVLNLAAAIHRHNKPSLVIDMDPQGHLSQIHPNPQTTAHQSLFSFYQDNKPLSSLAIEWDEIGKLICSQKELIKVDSIFGKGPAILNRLKQGLDVYEKDFGKTSTLIDCCPYLGVLSLSAIFASDLVLIPIASDFLSLQGAQKVEHTLKALEPVLKKRVARRYLMTCYDRRRGMTFEVHEQAKDYFGEEVCKTVISENVAVAESPQYKQNVFQYNSSSSGAHDYETLLDELIKEQLITLNQ